MNIARLLISLVVLGVANASAAPRFDRLDTNQELTQRTVTAIAQDASGFMWFGTQYGLNRYDGYEIIQYLPGQAEGLTASYINDLVPGIKGGLWVATDGGGVLRFDPASRSFGSYPGAPERTFVLRKDSSGRIWAGGERGLYRLEGAAFQRIGLEERLVLDLVPAPEGGLFVATDRGLWHRNAAGQMQRVAPKVLPERLTALAMSPAGTLWVGSDRALYEVSPSGELRNTYLAGRPVTELLVTGMGVVWAGLENGAARITPDRTVSLARHASGQASSIGPGIIFSLFEDRDGVIWIGTHGGGVSKYVPAHNLFKVLRHREGESGSLSSNTIMPILAEPDGTLWVGTYDAGLNLRRPGAEAFSHFRHSASQPDSLPSDNIRALYRDSRGRLWVGTNDAGLARYDAEHENFIHYPPDVGNPSALQHASVISLIEAPGDQLWVGTWGGGLHLFDPARGEVVQHYSHHDNDPGSLANNLVMDLARDNQGRLWVATRGGLDLYLPDSATFKHFRARGGPENIIECLASAADGTLWLGTRGGLAHFFPASGEFQFYTAEDGLRNELVVGVLIGPDGDVWASTQSGLARLDPDTGTIRTFGIADGLPGDEFNSFGFDSGPQGELYFGGMEGVAVFDPADLTRRLPAPTVSLTHLWVNHNPVHPQTAEEALLRRPIWLTKQLTFTYRHRMFAFEFAALDYAAPEYTRYIYKLEGFDPKWIETGPDRRMATYTNLDPGRYVFKVKAASGAGVFGDNPAQIGIQVQPPPWLTWWAYLGYFLIAMLILAGIFRYVLLQREMQHAEATSRMKSTFMAVLSHEIRNPLSAMLGTVELLRRTALDKSQREHAENLRYAGDALLSTVNDVLDYTREEAGEMPLERVLFSLRQAVAGVVALLSASAAEKELELTSQFGKGVPDMLLGDPNRLRQILLNLIGNAAKFTREGSIQICIKLLEQSQDQCRLRFEIIDSGPGISPEAQTTLFQPYSQAESSIARRYGGSGLGLAICKHLVQLQGGSIGIDSEPGQGATFWFELDFATVCADEILPAATATGDSTQSRRILVVEDLNVNRRVTCALLESDGHQVVEAENGLVARRCIEENGPFDVVFMDMHMPVEDGLTATQRLRASNDSVIAKTPVIALTGSVEPAQRQACLAAGMNQVLVKPVTLAMLREALARLDAGSRQASPALSENAETDILEITVLKAHTEALGYERVQSIVAQFDNTAEELLKILHTQLENGAGDGARETAHALAGAAAGLGCSALCSRLQDLEARLDRDDPQSLLDEYREICKIWKETKAAINELISSFELRHPTARASAFEQDQRSP